MIAAMPVQPRLLELPMVGLMPTDMKLANHLLIAWRHKLGAVHRPFTQLGYVLELQGEPISVAVSASAVSDTVAGYSRFEVVECARLCSSPDHRWATRIMLRLWREACARQWPDWTPRAAISYSHNAMHSGDIYRFDGWERVRTDCGSSGGGTYSTKRMADDPRLGPKTLWVWRFR